MPYARETVLVTLRELHHLMAIGLYPFLRISPGFIEF